MKNSGKASSNGRGLQVGARGHDAGRRGTEDRHRLARRAALPEILVAAAGERAPAAARVEAPAEAREAEQRALQAQVAAGEELRRAVGVAQQRGGEADAGVRFEMRAQRRHAAGVHDAVGVEDEDVVAARGGEGGVDGGGKAGVRAHLQQPTRGSVAARARTRSALASREALSATTTSISTPSPACASAPSRQASISSAWSYVTMRIDTRAGAVTASRYGPREWRASYPY